MITKNFIKMCEKNEDLQKAWKPTEFDIFTYDGTSLFKYPLVERTKKWVIEHTPTYLPTLEQLFDMVGEYKAQISRVFLSIMIMKKYKFESIQELVLNAVMEIKYKKYWTGEKWVEITKDL
jgi:hypothetical protein